MSQAVQWRSTVNVILPHPVRPQILVQRAEDSWRLPQLTVPQRWIAPLDQINEAMRCVFGIETTVLQLRAGQEEETRQRADWIYLLETHRIPRALAADLRWIETTELGEIEFVLPHQRAAVETYFREAETGIIPALRASSARPGWLHEAESWLQNQLAQTGYTVNGPVEQVKNWFLSCILRIPTAQGNVYFKATHGSPLMIKEAQMTEALAQLFPQLIPKPIAIEPLQDWMLLSDFGSEVGWDAALATREEVLCAFGGLQIASAAKVDELFALGCIDRRLPRLAEQIDPLLNDAEMLAYVDGEQQQRLLAAAARLKTICTQLEQYRVPATLVHGDMHMSNVARNSASYLFFDWSDACIAHPFLDMIDILHEREPARQTQLRDRYLALWSAYEPMDRLLAMWQLAYPLCALHQAVSYQAIIVTAEEICKPHLAWAMPFWFGEILASLAGQSNL